MKPDTLRVFTGMSIDELKGELKQIADAHDLDILDADICREVATNCQNIIDVAAALQNLYLTAAEELDKIDIVAEDMKAGTIAGIDLAADVIPWGKIPTDADGVRRVEIDALKEEGE